MGWRDTTRRIMDSVKSAFGEGITYTPVGGSALSLVAVIDEAYEAVDPNTGASIISNQPIITIKIDDLGQLPQKGDAVTMRSSNYLVIEYQTDGQAAYRILLHKAGS